MQRNRMTDMDKANYFLEKMINESTDSTKENKEVNEVSKEDVDCVYSNLVARYRDDDIEWKDCVQDILDDTKLSEEAVNAVFGDTKLVEIYFDKSKPRTQRNSEMKDRIRMILTSPNPNSVIERDHN